MSQGTIRFIEGGFLVPPSEFEEPEAEPHSLLKFSRTEDMSQGTTLVVPKTQPFLLRSRLLADGT
jgi:hypothetical protein